MLKVTVKNNVVFPEITLKEDLEYIADEIVIKDLIEHIDLRASIDMGALPPNAPATKKRKGHDHQLIDTGELRNSFLSKSAGEKKVIVTIRDGRKEIGGYLQDGIKTKTGTKRYIFFGLSDFAIEKAIVYMRDTLVKRLNGGRKR